MRNLLALLFFVPSLCLAQLPEFVSETGLIGWYPLDGDIVNAANPDEPSILTGGDFVLGQDGLAEGALGITNGSSAEIHPEIGTTESLTVSMWLNEGTNSGNSTALYTALYLGQQGFDGDTTKSLDITRDRINHPGNGRLQANLNYDFGTAGFDELDGGWVHLVSVFDSGLLSIYRNGFLMESTESSVSSISITGASFLGAGHVGNSTDPFNFCHCALDDVGIWNRVLTEEEVQALFLGAPIEYGCTDPDACNFDEEAVDDDGSCVLPPEVDLGPDVLSCSGTAVLSVPEGDANYTWTTGETVDSIVVTEPGSYSVTAVLDSPDPAVDGFQFLYTSQGLDHFLSYYTVTWSQAHLICQQNGGDLVSISDGAANSMLGIIDVQDAWIGLYQDDDNAPWQWTDGSDFDFQNWRSDQPSGSDQHCVLFWPEAAPSGAPDAQNIWSDETCTDLHHFLMAKPTASYSCQASDTINVHILDAPDLDLGEAVALCHDGGTLDAGPGFSSYAWSTGAATQMIDVFEAGEYSVSTTFGGAPPNVSSVELEGTGGALESAIQTTDSLTDATWMGWFWFDDLDAPQGLLAQNNGYNTNGYYINTNPFFDIATSTGGGSNSAIWFSSPVGSTNQNAQSWTQADVILPMTWHHIAVVLENGLIHIHVDGIAASMHNSFNEDWLALYDVDQHVVEVSDAPFRLGSGTDISGNAVQVMHGKMDGISLWNRALTQDEIQGYMNCPPSAASAGIQALWTFEDPSPLEDQSGQGHDATLASGQIVSEAPVSICPSCTTQDTVLVVHMDCEGLCGDGTVWDSSLGTCVSVSEPSQGQCGPGTVWDPVNEECIIAIPADLNYDGCVTVADLLELLAVHGTCPPLPEWPDEPIGTTWACGDPLTYWDHDYATVLIDDQCWFAENLRNERFNNGDSIPYIIENDEWAALTTSGMCWYQHNPAGQAQLTGGLYNWYSVNDTRQLCPSGWHVSTDEDWMALELSSGMDSSEIETTGFRGTASQSGVVLKASSNWCCNSNGTDSLGFNGQAGGYRNGPGNFGAATSNGIWWTSNNLGWWPMRRDLTASNDGVQRCQCSGSNDGFSVRCIKD